MTKAKRVLQDPILKELDGIKRLLVLFLIKAGASQGEIALARRGSRRFRPNASAAEGETILGRGLINP